MSVRIGELAAEAGVTTKTIRYYESIGLLAPPERTPAGYRAYGPDAIDRLVFIRDAQATGLSLTEIQSILELKDAGRSTCEHSKALLARHLDELDAQIDRLTQTRIELLQLSGVAVELIPLAEGGSAELRDGKLRLSGEMPTAEAEKASAERAQQLDPQAVHGFGSCATKR